MNPKSKKYKISKIKRYQRNNSDQKNIKGTTPVKNNIKGTIPRVNKDIKVLREEPKIKKISK